jgi:hypothetical protein
LSCVLLQAFNLIVLPSDLLTEFVDLSRSALRALTTVTAGNSGGQGKDQCNHGATTRIPSLGHDAPRFCPTSIYRDGTESILLGQPGIFKQKNFAPTELRLLG